MDQNTWFLLTVVLGVIFVSIFFYLIYLKVKLMGRRKELQKEGIIPTSFNLYLTTVFEIVFWMLPVFIKYNVKDELNRKLMKQINLLWIIMVIASIVVIKIG